MTNPTPPPDYDGCNSQCRRAGKHTLTWGLCEHAVRPQPTVNMSKIYRAADGHNSIGYDTYTVPELARLIEPVLGDPLKAAAAARAIVHRNDTGPAAATVPASAPTDQAAVCICGHPMHQHHEDVCLTECGCNDGQEPEGVADLPDRLAAALTARFTELGNPFSEMRRHEQCPDAWPASHPVGPHQVAEVLRELIGRTAVDGPRLPDHTVNEEETPDACHPDESIAGLRRPAPRDRHRSAWKALTPQQQAAYLAQLDNDKAQQKPCAECDHPKAVHSDGEDPVSPGRCTTCPDSGEEWHNYQAAEASAPTDRCPHGCNVSVCPCLECDAEDAAADRAAILASVVTELEALRDKTDVNVAEYPRYDARQRGALDDGIRAVRRLADAACPYPEWHNWGCGCPTDQSAASRPACSDPIECSHEAALGQAEAAIARVRSVLEWEHVLGRSALDYRGLITAALMADAASGPGRADGEPQQDETRAAAGVRFFTIAEDQAHSSEPEGYDSSGCSCNPADDQYTLEIEEGGCILIHTACGKQPPSHWGDWTDLLAMQPVPVTAKWIPNCDGSEWHGDHRCDCGSTLQISPADPATLAAIALTDITRQPKPAPAADAVRDQPAADTSWTILTHRNGTWTPWLGERHTAAEAREDFNTTVAVHGTKWAFRLVRHDTTHTVEAEHQPDKEA